MKTLVVFLEGTDWPLLQPLADRGLLPTIQRLVTQGTCASLMGVAPFSAPMLLASALTGKRAWRHGVVATGQGGPTAPRPLTATLGEIAGAAGLPSLVIGGQNAMPANPCAGVFVAEPFFTSNEQADRTVFPTALAEELAPLLMTPRSLDPGIIRLLCPRLHPEVSRQDPLAGCLAAALSHLYSVHNVASSLLETEPWELGVVHHSFMATIRTHFGAMNHADTPRAIRERYRDVVEGACRLLDLLLRELLAAAGGPAIRVVLASTRGGETLHPRVMVDYPLRSPGAGWFAAAGPGLRKGLRPGTLNVLDLAPTVLHSLELPVPGDMDGRLLSEIFDRSNLSPASESPSPVGAQAGLPVLLPLDAFGAFNLGVDLFEASHFAGALPLLERATRLQPESPVFAFWLACCQARLGLHKEAWTTSEGIRDHVSTNRLDASSRLALLAAQSKQGGKRPSDFLPLPITPGTLPPIAISILADSLIEERRWEEAFALLRDQLPLRPNNDVWIGLTRCYLHLHRYHDAEKAARHVIADNQGLAFAHIHLAKALKGLGRREEAEAALREAHRLAPHWPEVRAAVSELQPALATLLPWREPVAPPTPPTRTESTERPLKHPPESDRPSPLPATHLRLGHDPRDSFAYRCPRPDETSRVLTLLAEPKMIAGDWRPRVWESQGDPRRFIGAASWRLADDAPDTAHLFITMVPRFQKAEFAQKLLHPSLTEIKTSGVGQIIVTTREEADWATVFRHHYPTTHHWTDEDWSGDPVLLREHLRRYDPIEASAHRNGWTLRPFAEADWDLVRRWGVKESYLTSESLEQLRRRHHPSLSCVAIHDSGPAGILVATLSNRTATLAFISGHPTKPELWGTATALMLRWFVAMHEPVAPYDSFTFTTNLNRNRAMHTLAKRLALRRTREHHHFQVTLPK